LPRTGGRRKGTPNKRTQDVIERLRELDCDPIEGMARIAMDEGAPIETRARMDAELAQYIAPKRKAVEMAAEISEPQPRVIILQGVSASRFTDGGRAPTVVLPDNGRGLPGESLTPVREGAREPRQPPPREQNAGVQAQGDLASRLPTVRIKHPNSTGYCIINRSDFNPAVHELADDNPAGLSVVGVSVPFA
jgi:hypothetical protein